MSFPVVLASSTYLCLLFDFHPTPFILLFRVQETSSRPTIQSGWESPLTRPTYPQSHGVVLSLKSRLPPCNLSGYQQLLGGVLTMIGMHHVEIRRKQLNPQPLRNRESSTVGILSFAVTKAAFLIWLDTPIYSSHSPSVLFRTSSACKCYFWSCLPNVGPFCSVTKTLAPKNLTVSP
jgi:hypothetical protein